ncbi:MAG: hypothetical protein EP340_09575 [Alphaproteobacteria bacterium]|nr:MAG: hypothetical protein EP340_09575 [Alphaproteobacteria bacterium]
MQLTKTFLAATLFGALALTTPSLAKDCNHDDHHTFTINFGDHRDIEDLSDEELAEVNKELKEGLEEIKEARIEIKEELEHEESLAIAEAALKAAEASLDGAESAIKDTLKDVEAEQAKRAKAKK